MTVRLASYNVHKCVGMDGRRSPQRILDVLDELGADIIVLQEVDRRLGPRPAALPLTLIDAGRTYAALPLATTDVSLGWHGQSILTRRGMHLLHLQRIVLPGLEPRGAILADVDTTAGPLRVVGVHLGLIRRYRQMQFAAIQSALSRHRDLPTVIIGDYNEWSSRDGVSEIAEGFHVHAPGPTYPATRPVGPLDRVAVGGGAHLIGAGVHRTPLSRVASDHLPIWADVRIGAAAD